MCVTHCLGMWQCTDSYAVERVLLANMEDVCQGCDVYFSDSVNIFIDHAKAVDFLCGHGLITRRKICPKCGSEVDINEKLVFYVIGGNSFADKGK